MDTLRKPRGSIMARALIAAALLAAALLLIGGIIALFNPHMNTATATTAPKWGAYAGDASSFLELQARVGQPADIAATFVGFEDEFPQDFVSATASTTTTPLIFLETPSGTSLADVLSGTYDANLKAFAAKAAAYGKPIILVPFNEPNLNESPWGFGTNSSNTAENFKLAWARVHKIFSGAPNVKFGIAYNNVSIPEDPANTFENLYPGDALVDYVGIDAFNWQEDGVWQSFADVMGSTTLELKQFNKPIYIFSVGTGEDTGGNQSLKAIWIKEMYTWLRAHAEVVGFVWFNEDKSTQGEKNWLLDSSAAAFAAFTQGLKH